MIAYEYKLCICRTINGSEEKYCLSEFRTVLRFTPFATCTYVRMYEYVRAFESIYTYSIAIELANAFKLCALVPIVL